MSEKTKGRLDAGLKAKVGWRRSVVADAIARRSANSGSRSDVAALGMALPL
jgi:hypothetical protein